ncbi:MAG TPA: glutathione S-transferase family protein [Verrucomicrobiae bacterium]|jgi:glutathione S-transferase|nr:glutathione S-transferase family protein [Verrucomicrobiae bacterium]
MKLYYHPNSPNSTDVLATAYQLGIALDLELVELTKGAQKNPAYLKINPNGRVPAVVDGDFIIWESNAIMQYIASKKPGNPLWPQDDKTRADICRWQFWQASQWNRGAGMLVWENLIKKFLNLGAPDPLKIKEGTELFHASAAVLDAHLKDREYLVGRTVTLADFSVAAMLVYAGPGGYPLENYNNIRVWYGRVAALDAWKKALPPMPSA